MGNLVGKIWKDNADLGFLWDKTSILPNFNEVYLSNLPRVPRLHMGHADHQLVSRIDQIPILD